MEQKQDTFSYDEAVAQVEAIVARLESRDTQSGFDSMIADVEKALKLIDLCKKNISEAEAKLAKLSNSATE